MEKFIPYLPMIDKYSDEIARKIKRDIDAQWINHKAPSCKEFSEKLSKFLNNRSVILTHSDSASLDLLILWSRQKAGLRNRVYYILPATAFIADLWAVLKNGGVPILVDIDINNGLMPTYETVKSAVEAIKEFDKSGIIVYMAVYTGANVAKDTDKTFSYLRQQGVLIIEDCAHVFGAKYPDGKLAGTKGDFSLFSFHAAKVLNIGEGGAITMSSYRFADEYKELKHMIENYGLDSSWQRYPTIMGYNYRMPMPQCAVGSVLMDNVDELINTRKKIAMVYDELWDSYVKIDKLQPLHRYLWGSDGLDRIGIYKYIIFYGGETISKEKVAEITEKMGKFMVAKCNGLNLGDIVENSCSHNVPQWLEAFYPTLHLQSIIFPQKFFSTDRYTNNHFSLPLYNNPRLIEYIPEILKKLNSVFEEVLR